jgi:RNA polymerase sigma factor (sigma-70 family)
VFLEAWRGRGRTSLARPSALPWLLGVAVNLLRNQRRAVRRRKAAGPAAAGGQQHHPDPADAVAARVESSGPCARSVRRLTGCPGREQEVLELCVWAGLDYQQVAQTLGVTTGTVGSRLSRARTSVVRPGATGGRTWRWTSPG